eukprot:1877945-Amphidinium_carterae.1
MSGLYVNFFQLCHSGNRTNGSMACNATEKSSKHNAKPFEVVTSTNNTTRVARVSQVHHCDCDMPSHQAKDCMGFNFRRTLPQVSCVKTIPKALHLVCSTAINLVVAVQNVWNMTLRNRVQFALARPFLHVMMSIWKPNAQTTLQKM